MYCGEVCGRRMEGGVVVVVVVVVDVEVVADWKP